MTRRMPGRNRTEMKRHVKEAVRGAFRRAAAGSSTVNVVSRINRAIATNVGESGSAHVVVSGQDAVIKQTPESDTK